MSGRPEVVSAVANAAHPFDAVGLIAAAGTKIVSLPAVLIAALETVGACVKLTTPPEEIDMASVSDAEPIVPASLMMISSLKVTIPAEDMVIASVAEAEPTVPSSGTVTLVPVSASVPALEGRVTVTSAVDAGPMRVTAFVPLSLSSKNFTKPALVAPFLISAPALITGVVSVLKLS
jgi:hypothetical protein